MNDTPSDDLVKRLEREVYQEAIDKLKLLCAELGETKEYLDRLVTEMSGLEAEKNEHFRRAEQAEAARDRFAAVLWAIDRASPELTAMALDGTEHEADFREAIAHHRAKQEKEQSRG